MKQQRILKLLFKYLALFEIGGLTYFMCETLFRGFSHSSMFFLGGLCFILMGLLNEIIPWEMPYALQMLISCIMITALEFFTGLIVNMWLGLNVWDYTNFKYNVLGQICLEYSVLWYFISAYGIFLDDMVRFYMFDEEFPRYTLFKWGKKSGSD